ncbi:MAG: hypothetical protein ACRCVV_12230 [Shewanella sp.]
MTALHTTVLDITKVKSGLAALADGQRGASTLTVSHRQLHRQSHRHRQS